MERRNSSASDNLNSEFEKEIWRESDKINNSEADSSGIEEIILVLSDDSIDGATAVVEEINLVEDILETRTVEKELENRENIQKNPTKFKTDDYSEKLIDVNQLIGQLFSCTVSLKRLPSSMKLKQLPSSMYKNIVSTSTSNEDMDNSKLSVVQRYCPKCEKILESRIGRTKSNTCACGTSYQYRCRKCLKTAEAYSKIYSHTKRCNNESYSCSKCDYTTKEKNNFNKHLMIHKNEKVYNSKKKRSQSKSSRKNNQNTTI